MVNDLTLQLKAPWEEVKERIKEVNSGLTDEDLDYTPGREDELLGHLSVITEMSPEQVKAWIESISSNEGKAS